MVRTIGFFMLVGCSAVLSVLGLDFLGLDRAFGNLLEALLGPLNNEADLAMGALTGMLVGCGALVLVLAVPAWKASAGATVVAWPIPGHPCASYLIRTTLFPLIIAVFLMLAGGLRDLWHMIVLIGAAAALCGMMLYDFRAVVLSNLSMAANPGQANGNQATAGWVMPDAITAEMLGLPELRFELARDLRRRAVQMRRFSFIALTGIGALLVIAVCVILFAGFIANLGVGKSGPERIQELLDSESRALDAVQNQLQLLDQQLQRDELVFYRSENRTRADIKTTSDPAVTDQMRAAFKMTPEYDKAQLQKIKLLDYEKAHRNAIRTILEERTAYLQKNIQSDFGTAEEADNLNLLIASGITRFGILFIMLFIVQILVNLYRYTMRLSAYYLSQADALLLATDGGDALLKLVPALSPAQVDFGKTPDTPAQNLEKLLEMAAKLRSAT